MPDAPVAPPPVVPEVATPAPQPTGPSYFVDTSGQTVQVPPEQAGQAAEFGYTPASPEQVRAFETTAEAYRKFGGVGGALKAGAAAAARAATLGLSDVVLVESGAAKPETLEGLRKTQPGMNAAGTLLGIAGPMVATGGLGGAATVGKAGVGAAVSKATAPVLISRVGRAVESVVDAALPSAEGALGQILRKAAVRGSGSAVEGGLYGAGEAITERELGDPDITAEKVAAMVGAGALLGGGLGAAFGAGEAAVPKAVEKARETVSSVYKKTTSKVRAFQSEAESFTETNKATADILWERSEEVADVMKAAPDLGKVLDRATPEMAEHILANKAKYMEMEKAFPGTTRQLLRAEPQTADFMLENWQKIMTDPNAKKRLGSEAAKNMQDVFKTVDDLLKTANREILPAEAERLVASMDTKAAVKAYENVFEKLDDTIGRMRSKSEQFHSGRMSKLEDIREGLLRDVEAAENPYEAYKRFRQLRRHLDELIPWGQEAGEFTAANTAKELKALRRAVSDTLHDEGVFGKAAVRRAALDEAESSWYQTTRKKGEFYQQFMSNGQVKHTKVGTWLNQMADFQGENSTRIWSDTIKHAQDVIEQVSKSNEVAQVSAFNRKALDDLMTRVRAATEEGSLKAKVTNLKSRLMERTLGGSNAITNVAAEANPIAESLKGLARDKAAGLAEDLASFVPGGRTAARVIREKFQAAYEDTKSVSRTVQKLATLEHFASETSQKVQTAVEKIVRGGTEATRGVRAAGAASAIGTVTARSVEDYGKKAAEIRRLAQNPESLHNALTKQTDDLHEHAPETSTALQTVNARRVSFLASKVPNGGKTGPLGSELEPSRAELAKFGRYYEAAEHPHKILAQAAETGVLTAESLETLQTVYPKLYQDVCERLLDEAAGGRKIPYARRLLMSTILGMDVDGSLKLTQANQQVLQGPTAKNPQDQVKPSPTGMRELAVANRNTTPAQRSSLRGDEK